MLVSKFRDILWLTMSVAARKNINAISPDDVKVAAVADTRYNIEGRDKDRERGWCTHSLVL